MQQVPDSSCTSPAVVQANTYSTNPPANPSTELLIKAEYPAAGPAESQRVQQQFAGISVPGNSPSTQPVHAAHTASKEVDGQDQQAIPSLQSVGNPNTASQSFAILQPQDDVSCTPDVATHSIQGSTISNISTFAEPASRAEAHGTVSESTAAAAQTLQVGLGTATQLSAHPPLQFDEVAVPSSQAVSAKPVTASDDAGAMHALHLAQYLLEGHRPSTYNAYKFTLGLG